VLTSLDSPIEVAGQQVTAGVSIGISLDAPETAGVDDLLGRADIAMYRAKSQGKGRHHVFSPQDLLDNEAAAGRQPHDGTDGEPRRGISFRGPSVRRPALGSEPG
jgi:hypothetical protein